MATRPPFTGIDEISSNSGGGAPNEGGGNIPPFGEDWLQTITDINFGDAGGGNGVFASGDICCFIRAAYVPKPTLNQHWVGIGPIGFTEDGDCYSASYAVIDGKPTFLIGGDSFNQTPYYGGLIMASHNGFYWFEGFYLPQTSSNVGIANLVWDPRTRRFYANPYNGDCWTSATGISGWEKISDNFWDHCINGYPDGIVGYNPGSRKHIYPADVPSDVIAANCVAFANGIWMAGGSTVGNSLGRSCTASSIDDGETWYVVSSGDLGMTEDFGIEAIVGSPF